RPTQRPEWYKCSIRRGKHRHLQLLKPAKSLVKNNLDIRNPKPSNLELTTHTTLETGFFAADAPNWQEKAKCIKRL
ncbi:MAG: hypothetical protein MI867_27660, partial [Pseudomonadales bacterium]|nr:hypothetical protein [Pseudomonadales bacterium]